MRWAAALHDRLTSTPDVRLLIGERREPFVEASRPLAEQLQAVGFGPERRCRPAGCSSGRRWVSSWSRAERTFASPRAQNKTMPGGNPSGITAAEARRLFRLNLQFVLEGLARHNTLPTH